MSKRDIGLYLQDILISLQRIEDYTKDLTPQDFEKDWKTIDAVVRNLEVIGEAAKNIPEDMAEKYSSIPWDSMVSMRNKVIHEYFGIDIDILWKTIKEDLPPLQVQISQIV